MTSSYDDIFNLVLTKITDYDLLSMTDNDIYNQMSKWLHMAASKPKLRKLFSEFALDDETMSISFTLRKTFDDDFSAEFTNNVLACGCLTEWIKPRINSTLNISQMFGGKEQKFYSQANHLDALLALDKENRKEYDRLIRDYAYNYFGINGADNEA